MVKVGDRVKVYGPIWNISEGSYDTVYGFIVKLSRVTSDSKVHGEGSNGVSYSFHPKQCRKLKPKKRKTYWMPKGQLENVDRTGAATVHVTTEKVVQTDIEFQEVQISRRATRAKAEE